MKAKPNLTLVGFMGAGKSTVGRGAARTLHMKFVDTDAEIEQAAGRTIPEIFADEGEEAFRRRERDVVTELGRRAGHVIATGGGAFVDPDVRNALMEGGLVVYLEAPFEVLWRRVGHVPGRPLLAGQNGKERARQLFLARQATYRLAHDAVDAARPYEQVVDAVVEVYQRYAKLDDR